MARSNSTGACSVPKYQFFDVAVPKTKKECDIIEEEALTKLPRSMGQLRK
jgi:hypothetical protein